MCAHTYTETHRYTQTYTQRGRRNEGKREETEKTLEIFILQGYMEHKSKAHSVRILPNGTVYLALAFLYLEILGPIQLNCETVKILAMDLSMYFSYREK